MTEHPVETAPACATRSEPSTCSRRAAGGIVRAEQGEHLLTGPLGAQLLHATTGPGGGLALVVHTLAPRALGAPVHTHEHEDEYSYVLEGEVGMQLGDVEEVARPGDLVTKPRGVPHAFWNASDAPARLLEVITPAGFERYFAGLAELFASGPIPHPVALSELAAGYGLDVDPASVPRLAQAHRLALA